MVFIEPQPSHPSISVLVSPAGFKGSLHPDVAADCIEASILDVLPDAHVQKVPLFDGGEGFTRALVAATAGTLYPVMVPGPLNEPVASLFGILGHSGTQEKDELSDSDETPSPAHNIQSRKTAVIEMSAAAGLSLLPPGLRNPCATSTFGVGALILAAMDAGAQRIVIGCGDSATYDGGCGMLQALGARLLDVHGDTLPIAAGGASILTLATVDMRDLDPRILSGDVAIEAAVNWANVLTGPRGQARIYSPQKGADEQQIEVLSAAMDVLARAAGEILGESPEMVGQIPGSGASGGMGTALLMIGGTLRPRYDVMGEFLPDLDSLFNDNGSGGFDLVVTAEGGLDGQTPRGKMPAEVARRAARRGIPVVAIAGTIGPDAADNHAAGIDAYACMLQGPTTLEQAMADARRLLREGAAGVMRTVLVGSRMAEARERRGRKGGRGYRAVEWRD